jgi:hypothetical protein
MVDDKGETNMATTNLLNKVLERAAAKGYDRFDALVLIAKLTDTKGLYQMAKHWGVLVQNSAADFACEFYSTYNREIAVRY